jgi:hypothetical protein
MCEQCFPEGVEIGEFVKGFSLIFSHGQYLLLGSQGHSSDRMGYFEVEPYEDPDPDSDCVFLNDHELKWIDDAESFYDTFDPGIVTSYLLVKGCVEQGYNIHKPLEQWIFNRAGKMIREWKEKFNGMEVND